MHRHTDTARLPDDQPTPHRDLELQHGAPPQFDRLRSLRPDVAVVQECADPDAAGKGSRPDCTSYDSIGFNPDKGLGIFTFGDLR